MHSNTFNNDNILLARNLVESKEFKKAYDFLCGMSNKCSEWFYLKGISAMNIGYYEEGESLIKEAQILEPQNNKFKKALDSFNMYRDNYRSRSYEYNRRRHHDPTGCCCCCCDGCCTGGDDACDMCCKLWCLDSMCECMGGDLISCC